MVAFVIIETAVLFVLVLFASYLLSKGAELIAERYGANFAGSIVLALITTLPEYLFVFWACMKGEYQMAIGSAIGACAILITLGYGLVILVATSKISKKPVKYIALSQETRIDAIYLAVTALIAFIVGWEGNGFDLKDGVILIALFLLYVYHIAKVGMKYQSEHEHTQTRRQFYISLLTLLLGGAIIVGLSEPFVESMIELSSLLGISVVAIAIIIGPFASELPEKLTAFLTVMRDGRLAEISVTNFLGSKVNHNSLLFGTIPLIAYFMGSGAVSGVITLQFAMMTGLTFLATASVASRKLYKWQGLLFIGLYVVWVWVAFLLA